MEELFIEDLGKVTGGQCQPDLTTQALGEEGGAPPVDPGRGGGGPDLTTFALGEEGGAPPIDPGRGGGRGPDLTTFALGEEGGAPSIGF